VFLDCVHRPRFHKTWISLRFGDWLCLRLQVYKIRGGEGYNGIKFTQFGPLEGANVNHCTFHTSYSRGPGFESRQYIGAVVPHLSELTSVSLRSVASCIICVIEKSSRRH
jgi:hypothetical protein